ncbi:MAG: hypothetical protein ACTSRI_02400 [Promethearchaeota archaeon]
MQFLDRKEEQRNELYILEDKLLKENINIKDVKSLMLIDKEGKYFFEDFEDDFLILTRNDKTILFEAIYNANDVHLYDLRMHGKLFKDQLKKDYDELILLFNRKFCFLTRSVSSKFFVT